MPSFWWKSAGDLVNDAAVECNLDRSVDPFSSYDQNFKLLCRLLNSCGVELSQHTPPLQSLIREATLSLSPGDSGVYSLPDDFYSLRDQTAWCRTSHFPAIGPVSSQAWQATKALSLTGLALSVPWRIAGNFFETYPQPVTAAGTITIEYVSRAWVMSKDSPVADSDSANASSDVVTFEPLLVTRMLKYHWKGEKGFDTTKALADYEASLAAAESVAPARVLSLVGRRNEVRLLGWENVPDGRWGY